MCGCLNLSIISQNVFSLISRYFKNSLKNVLEIGNEMGIISDKEMKEGCFDFYKAPPLDSIKKLGLQMHWWSYYKPWLPQENFYYASKHPSFISLSEIIPISFPISKTFSNPTPL